MKLAWGMVSNPSSLWVQVLRIKYNGGNSAMPKVHPRANCSHTWRAITKVWKDFLRGVQWSVGNGHLARFWSDSWLPSGLLLRRFLPEHLAANLLELPVAHYSEGHRGWKTADLRDVLPSWVIDQIEGTQPAHAEMGEDVLIWAHSSNGKFSTKSAYNAFFGDHAGADKLWNAIWK